MRYRPNLISIGIPGPAKNEKQNLKQAITKLFSGTRSSGFRLLSPQDNKRTYAPADNKEREQTNQYRQIGVIARIWQLRRMSINTLLGAGNRIGSNLISRDVSC